MAESEGDVKWTPEMEVALLKAMMDHKPIGIMNMKNSLNNNL